MPASHSILVTGATGHIGQALVANLQAAGANVIAGSRTGKSIAGAPGRSLDFSDLPSVEKAFAGVDAAFLLFPLVPEKLDLARNAVTAARRAGVEHLVRSSGAGTDAHSNTALARLQGEVDDIVTGSGIAATIVAPSSFMQNWIDYYAGMIKTGTVYLPLAEGRTSYIDVRDIAAAAAAVLLEPATHAGRVYTLTGPEALGIADGLAEIGRITGRQARYVAVPEEAAVKSMQGMGMDAWTIEMMNSLSHATAAGATSGITDHVQVLTGRSPRSFADFIRDHADAWR